MAGAQRAASWSDQDDFDDAQLAGAFETAFAAFGQTLDEFAAKTEEELNAKEELNAEEDEDVHDGEPENKKMKTEDVAHDAHAGIGCYVMQACDAFDSGGVSHLIC